MQEQNAKKSNTTTTTTPTTTTTATSPPPLASSSSSSSSQMEKDFEDMSVEQLNNLSPEERRRHLLDKLERRTPHTQEQDN